MPPFLSYIPSLIKQVDSFSVVLSQRHFILQAMQAVHNGVWYVFQAGSIEEYDQGLAKKCHIPSAPHMTKSRKCFKAIHLRSTINIGPKSVYKA
jgi:hypothetical protein